MASRLSMNEVFQLMENYGFGLSSEDESDVEGQGVSSYLPEAGTYLSDGADDDGEESGDADGDGGRLDEPEASSDSENGQSNFLVR